MALEDLMKSFRDGSQPVQQQQNTQVVPGNIPATAATTGATNANTENNGVIPANTNANNNDGKTTEESPLAEFKDLFTIDDESQQQAATGIFGEVDPKKIMEAAGKVNFAKVLKPELMQRITAGGEDATRAMAEALNTVSQVVYAQSSLAATKLVENAVSRIEAKFDKDLPAKLKQHSFSNSMREDNPIFNDPAVAPIVSIIEKQMATKYPNATVAELNGMAKDYYMRAFKAASGTKDEQQSTAATGGTDWEKELGLA